MRALAGETGAFAARERQLAVIRSWPMGPCAAVFMVQGAGGDITAYEVR